MTSYWNTLLRTFGPPKYGRIELSSIVHHVLNSEDSVDKCLIKLARRVIHRRLLDAY